MPPKASIEEANITSEFVCRCNGRDDEVDGLMQRAVDYLNGGAGWARPDLVESHGFVSMAIHTLSERWAVQIKSVSVDQWFGFSAERRDWGAHRSLWTEESDPIPHSVPPMLQEYSIQCDRVEDGFAWLVLHMKDQDDAVPSTG